MNFDGNLTILPPKYCNHEAALGEDPERPFSLLQENPNEQLDDDT
jgi:hypothetical protein